MFIEKKNPLLRVIKLVTSAKRDARAIQWCGAAAGAGRSFLLVLIDVLGLRNHAIDRTLKLSGRLNHGPVKHVIENVVQRSKQNSKQLS